MAAWVSDLGLPSEPPDRRDSNRDNGPQSPLSFTNGGGESLSTSIPSTIKSSSNADMADILQISLPYADLAAAEAGPTTSAAAATTGVAARKHDEHDVTIGEQEAGPSCRHKYLVMGRLFKLHPDFDVAIEGILEGDKDGCVILIHETKDEEWTRVVWSRLRDVLAPRGRTSPTCMCDGESVLCQRPRNMSNKTAKTSVDQFRCEWEKTHNLDHEGSRPAGHTYRGKQGPCYNHSCFAHSVLITLQVCSAVYESCTTGSTRRLFAAPPPFSTPSPTVVV